MQTFFQKFIAKINKLNDAIAGSATLAMGTMWCVYLFLMWSLVPSAFPQYQEIVFYVSGGILQLVALPLILVGQNVLSQASEKIRAEDHARVQESLEHIHQIIADDDKEVERLGEIESMLLKQKTLLEDIQKRLSSTV